MDALTAISYEIRLYKTQVVALENLAAERGMSVEDLVRQAIGALLISPYPDPAEYRDDSELSEAELADDPLAAFIGLGRSGVNDLSINHDKYLMEFEIESNRPPPAPSTPPVLP